MPRSISRVVWILLALAPVALGQKIIFSGRSYMGGPLPLLDKGHLIYLTRPDHVDVYDREGLRLFQAVALDADGRSASISTAAIDTDETVAVNASFVLPQGYAGGIIFFDRSGRQTRIIPTGRFVPLVLCFDPNHDLWAFGWQRGETDWGMDDEKDYPIARKFSKDGKEVGRFLSRSSFSRRGHPIAGARGLWEARAARDRIGVFVYPFFDGHKPRWLELDLNGNLLGQWNIGEFPNGGRAYTEDGRLFAKNFDPKTQTPRLSVFDRKSEKWLPCDDPADAVGENFSQGLLLGSDGTQLVMANPGGYKLRWLDVP